MDRSTTNPDDCDQLPQLFQLRNLPSYQDKPAGNLLVSNQIARPFAVTKLLPKLVPRLLQNGGACPLLFVLRLAQQIPNNLRKGRQMDTIESTWDKFQKQLQNEDEAFDYEGTIRFTTDKQLTQEQLNQLMDIIALQIIEPVNEDQEDEDYSTRNVEVTVKEVE